MRTLWGKVHEFEAIRCLWDWYILRMYERTLWWWIHPSEIETYTSLRPVGILSIIDKSAIGVSTESVMGWMGRDVVDTKRTNKELSLLLRIRHAHAWLTLLCPPISSYLVFWCVPLRLRSNIIYVSIARTSNRRHRVCLSKLKNG